MAYDKDSARCLGCDSHHCFGQCQPQYDALDDFPAEQTALGEAAYRVAVTSPKSMVGHLLGGAGLVSGLAAVLAIRDGVIPPTINLETPDPECDLDYVPLKARRAEVNVAMINGFGFGGQNASVVFKRFQP